MNKVDLQLRTAVAGMGTSHLRIEGNMVVLHETDEGRPDQKAMIFLSQAQWADLAVHAAKMASEMKFETNDDRHMTNDDVLVMQEKNRLARLSSDMGEVLRYFLRAEGFVMGGIKDQAVVDKLVSTGELDVKESTVRGQGVSLYRINSHGRKALENEDYS